MLDFNHQPNLSEQICARIDGALQSAQAQQKSPKLSGCITPRCRL